MSFENNVVATLSSTVAADDTSITFNTPVTPFNIPPASGGTLTLSDNLNNPSAIEVITFTGVTDNLNGTHTITGVTRAQESTAAAPWSVGHVLYQAVTQASTNKWDTAHSWGDHSTAGYAVGGSPLSSATLHFFMAS